MKTHLKIPILVVAVALTINTQCIIDSLSLDSYGKQVICRIGEFHVSFYKPGTPEGIIEKRDAQKILGLIDAVGKTKRPTTVIIEAGDWVINFLQSKRIPRDIEPSAMPWLALNARQLMCQYQNLRVICPDKRTSISGEFERLFDYFASSTNLVQFFFSPLCSRLQGQEKEQFKTLFTSITSIEELTQTFDRFIQRTPQAAYCLSHAPNSVADQFVLHVEQNCPHTLEELFADSEKARQRIIEIIKDRNPQDPIRIFIEKTLQKTCAASESLKAFFQSIKSCKPGQSCAVAIRKALQEKTFTELEQHWENTCDISYFFDADIAIELCEALKNNNNVIIFTGANHTNNLDELITSLGCTQIFPYRKDLSTIAKDSLLTDKELESLFYTIKDAFLATKQALQQEALATCSTCSKSEALKRCARCKKVSYCSAECQKADWQKHKEICKAS